MKKTIALKTLHIKPLNEEIKNIKRLLSKPATFEAGKESFLSFHSKFYQSGISECKCLTFYDLLWENLDESTARTALNKKGRTIIYGIWHSARIEDITVNMLVNRCDQVYIKNGFKDSIDAGIDHTGNSLTIDQILTLSSRINIEALRQYHSAVGKATQQSVRKLNFEDLKRKILKNDIERVSSAGGVDDVPEANWLLDFWGRKTVEGILLMPACRHLIVHMNESLQVLHNRNKSKEKLV